MIKRTQVCSAVFVVLGGSLGVASIPAFGQQTLERVEITGSPDSVFPPSNSIPRKPRPSQMRERIVGAFSPMPPVITSVSSPPSAAA